MTSRKKASSSSTDLWAHRMPPFLCGLNSRFPASASHENSHWPSEESAVVFVVVVVEMVVGLMLLESSRLPKVFDTAALATAGSERCLMRFPDIADEDLR